MTNDYGLKVARDGYDVSNATLIEQVFNSGYSTMKTTARGTITSTASGERSIVIANLNYRPGFMAWFEVNGDNKWYPNGCVIDGTYVALYVNNSKALYADIYSSSSKTVIVYYAILADPGE